MSRSSVPAMPPHVARTPTDAEAAERRCVLHPTRGLGTVLCCVGGVGWCVLTYTQAAPEGWGAKGIAAMSVGVALFLLGAHTGFRRVEVIVREGTGKLELRWSGGLGRRVVRTLPLGELMGVVETKDEESGASSVALLVGRERIHLASMGVTETLSWKVRRLESFLAPWLKTPGGS
jgi:hypothetical protein